MLVCKERPASLPPLDAIGLEPVDHTHAMSRGGSGHHRPSSAVPPSHHGANNLFSMGNFATMGSGSKLSSKERYANNRATSVNGAPGMQYTSNRPSAMQRTASQGGTGAPLQKRVRSKRGENRNENNRVPGGSRRFRAWVGGEGGYGCCSCYLSIGR
jgi:translation initiation factor 4G